MDARDKNGQSPLNWAARQDNPATVTVLLDARANVNARGENGRTSLHQAAKYGTPVVIGLLLKAGARVNARDEDGATPLHLAAQSAFANPANVTKLTFLLASGADGSAKQGAGHAPFYYIKQSQDLKGTDAYWALHDAQYD